MKKVDDDDLLPEYNFDYSKARPNPYASQYLRGSRVVVLDPEVARVFRTAKSVNVMLRAILKAMPARSRSKKA